MFPSRQGPGLALDLTRCSFTIGNDLQLESEFRCTSSCLIFSDWPTFSQHHCCGPRHSLTPNAWFLILKLNPSMPFQCLVSLLTLCLLGFKLPECNTLLLGLLQPFLFSSLSRHTSCYVFSKGLKSPNKSARKENY